MPIWYRRRESYALVIEDRVFTIFLKPIGDVCYENENESTRVQLPKRDYFNKMKVSKRPFLLMGFDLENSVFVVWNPSNTKERLNTKRIFHSTADSALNEKPRRSNYLCDATLPMVSLSG